jgi:hypothetical protein
VAAARDEHAQALGAVMIVRCPPCYGSYFGHGIFSNLPTAYKRIVYESREVNGALRVPPGGFQRQQGVRDDRQLQGPAGGVH